MPTVYFQGIRKLFIVRRRDEHERGRDTTAGEQCQGKRIRKASVKNILYDNFTGPMTFMIFGQKKIVHFFHLSPSSCTTAADKQQLERKYCFAFLFFRGTGFQLVGFGLGNKIETSTDSKIFFVFFFFKNYQVRILHTFRPAKAEQVS